MNRREVLKSGIGFAAAQAVGLKAASHAAVPIAAVPIVDSHIHLFDTSRPGGVPWPLKTDKIYKPTLPVRFEQVTRGLGVVGAIVVEASPLEADNDWVLNQAAGNSKMLGVVGDLVPGSPSFHGQLERLHGNPLFVGIRYGNIWDRDLYLDRKKPGFISDLRRLASAGLSLDSANPDPRLIEALLAVSQEVPELRIVICHLPHAPIPTEKAERMQYWANVRALGQNARVFIKLSEVPVLNGNRVPTEVSFYKDKLDVLWDVFGEDRILFGSDWPNSDHVVGYTETLGIVRGYVATKGEAALEKYFWKNSVAAYRWHRRQADQPDDKAVRVGA